MEEIHSATSREDAAEEWSQADPLGDALISELEEATAALAALGQRVKQVASVRRTLEHDLAETRGQLAQLEAARAEEREHQRARNEAMKAKLAELLGELDD